MSTSYPHRTIVHVLESFHMGGGERVALDLATKQLARGCSVLAVSLSSPPEGPLGPMFREQGIATHTVAKGPRFDLTLVPKLVALFSRHRVDIVHVHNPLALIYGAPAGRLARASVVCTKHGEAKDKMRRLLLRRAAATFCSAVVCVSKKTARAAQERGEIPSKKVHVIPNGIDISRYFADERIRREVRAELGIPSNAWVVGTVGRLEPVKNQEFLLRSAAPLLNEQRRLVLVGDGPDRAALESLAEQLPNGQFVQFVGMRQDVPRILNAFDLFALSSRTEGLPLVLLEAMATGLPIVATSVGGVPEVIKERETGFLVGPADESAMRRRIKRFAEDPELGKRWGERARKLVCECYSLDRMVDDYFEIYNSKYIIGADVCKSPSGCKYFGPQRID
ncbi:MAG: glycosyltransferase [Pseudomonadota bacterium]